MKSCSALGGSKACWDLFFGGYVLDDVEVFLENLTEKNKCPRPRSLSSYGTVCQAKICFLASPLAFSSVSNNERSRSDARQTETQRRYARKERHPRLQ